MYILFTSIDGHASSGSGEDAVFFRVASQAQVDGKMERTKISVETTSDISSVFSNPGISGQLNGRYGKSASCGIFTVEFPAGAKEIVYDPTMGSGEDPFAESNLALIIGVSVGCAVVLLAIIGAFIFFRKRAQYQSL
jgi:hypothetical protein